MRRSFFKFAFFLIFVLMVVNTASAVSSTDMQLLDQSSDDVSVNSIDLNVSPSSDDISVRNIDSNVAGSNVVSNEDDSISFLETPKVLLNH